MLDPTLEQFVHRQRPGEPVGLGCSSETALVDNPAQGKKAALEHNGWRSHRLGELVECLAIGNAWSEF